MCASVQRFEKIDPRVLSKVQNDGMGTKSGVFQQGAGFVTVRRQPFLQLAALGEGGGFVCGSFQIISIATCCRMV